MPTKEVGSGSAIRMRFGSFELNVAERLLRNADEVIPLGGRAFDILLSLVEHNGEVVSKTELIKKVWPGVTVEEGSLRVHMSALRKALGDGRCGNRYITNVQGRGYSFVAPVTRQFGEQDGARAFAGLANLPSPLNRMIGREDAVVAIRSHLRAERLVTVFGPGGIGKTAVAVWVGHELLAEFSGAVFFVDLSLVRDKEQIVGAIASAIMLELQSIDPEAVLSRYLRSRRALLVLDGCEHVIEKTAEVVDGILRKAPELQVLATSREALQIADEYVFALNPLAFPLEHDGQTADGVLAYPAVRLFVDRINARGNEFRLHDDNAPVVAEICRKLDGIPLAIELAAGRAAIFGVKDTAARLSSRLDLLRFGRRTANPRHQTLRAMLDWSYDHLSESERVVFRRLSIFTGHFVLQAAVAVTAEEGAGQPDVTGVVGCLVEKSLIGPRSESGAISYRLLDTTRAYALERLVASGEHGVIAERHANFVTAYLETNSVGLFELGTSRAAAGSLRDFLGNVRSALDWSFGTHGSDRIAIRLAAAAAPLFLGLSLLLECRSWMLRAIERMPEGCDPQHQFEIHASLALSRMLTERYSETVRDAFNSALTLAELQPDIRPQLLLLGGLFSYFLHIGDAKETLALALRAEAVARTGKPDDAAIADTMLGAARWLSGEHRRAQKHLERALLHSPPLRRFNARQYLFDPRRISLLVLGLSNWFSGNLDRAVCCAVMAVEEAEGSDHPTALCRGLILTILLHFWLEDDLQKIARALSRLDTTVAKHSLEPFRAAALAFRGWYLIRLARESEGVLLLRDSLDKHLRFAGFVTQFVAELAVCLAKQNERTEALALIDESIAAEVASNRGLHLPALFLAKGQAFTFGDVPDLPAAEQCFERSMELARQQSALAFELRAGLELARVWIARNEARRVHDLIAPIYDRFTEGFATPDLVLARRLIKQTDSRAPAA
ncbi:winged helix-turn-helix domain-containing protein [Bradyrhizobium sp. WSM2254]|uniref:ATP-binding protein n=1 Tax=Bradyrhizobium sp. WSM2254 TaxID=1188263 RepID=UPI000411843A|nr:winged helix-turn-helix domain-containing protein [Bradyrhizobium sp. WSM2254]